MKTTQSFWFDSNQINSVGTRFFDNLVLGYLNFLSNNCTNSYLYRSGRNDQSRLSTRIRAAFSTCFKNFDDELEEPQKQQKQRLFEQRKR